MIQDKSMPSDGNDSFLLVCGRASMYLTVVLTDVPILPCFDKRKVKKTTHIEISNAVRFIISSSKTKV